MSILPCSCTVITCGVKRDECSAGSALERNTQFIARPRTHEQLGLTRPRAHGCKYVYSSAFHRRQVSCRLTNINGNCHLLLIEGSLLIAFKVTPGRLRQLISSMSPLSSFGVNTGGVLVLPTPRHYASVVCLTLEYQI